MSGTSSLDRVDGDIDRSVLGHQTGPNQDKQLTVPFLKPTLMDRALASSLCTCDSVVRAPIAPQDMRSARY
jgi:hypothetical protein